ncbi:MAG: acyl-CoA dehydrogenase family protein [Dehalococcoidia bacterium]
MDFTLGEEHQLVRTSVRQMLQKYAPRRDEFRRMNAERRFPQELWDDFARIGLLGCLVPEQYGGTNAGLLALTVAFEELTAQGFFPGLMLVTSMDAACIVRNGSEELKERFLPKIVAGELKLCFAVTEPNAGTNTFRVETAARRDGDVYRVSGQKVFITGVEQADYMLLVARTTSLRDLQAEGKPKSQGLSLFLVDTKSPGLEKTLLPTPSNDGAGQWQLFFDDVAVPAANLVGEEGNGAMAMFNSLNPERILAAAICSGMTQQCLEKSVAYAKERRVFRDTPIGAYQSIAHPLAEAKIWHEAVRLMMYRAAWSFDRGLDPLEVGTQSNMAKFLAADLALKAVDAAIETHGGNGFSEDYGIIHLWFGARLFKTAPVSREMILNYISEWSLGLPRSY